MVSLDIVNTDLITEQERRIDTGIFAKPRNVRIEFLSTGIAEKMVRQPHRRTAFCLGKSR